MILQFPFFRLNIFFRIVIILIVILAFIVQIALGAWIYKDAKKRNMDAALWLLVVLLTGLVGLVIYFIVREPLYPEKKEQPINTPSPKQLSEKEVTAQQKVVKLQKNNVKYCSNCGEEMPLKASFCSNCGNKV
jgi:thiol:disulfide interchange protein